jgi:hypothetical protein
LEGEKQLILVYGGIKENKLDHNSTFERMEMNRGRFKT